MPYFDHFRNSRVSLGNPNGGSIVYTGAITGFGEIALS